MHNTDEGRGSRRSLWPTLFVLVFLALLAFDAWLLLIRPDAPWDKRIGFVLGLLGIYTFAFGVLSETDLVKRVSDLGNQMTSPNLYEFIGGNALALSLVATALGVAVDPLRTTRSLERRHGTTLWVITQLPLVTIGFLIVCVYIVVYVVVIAPIAWLGYALVSAPLDSISGAARDMGQSITNMETGEQTTIWIKELVAEHKVALRNLLVAVPSLIFSLILDAPSLI